MFNIFRNKFTVEQASDGRFAIVKNGKHVIGTYGRRRDAVRGANRKGLTLANA